MLLDSIYSIFLFSLRQHNIPTYQKAKEMGELTSAVPNSCLYYKLWWRKPSQCIDSLPCPLYKAFVFQLQALPSILSSVVLGLRSCKLCFLLIDWLLLKFFQRGTRWDWGLLCYCNLFHVEYDIFFWLWAYFLWPNHSII